MGALHAQKLDPALLVFWFEKEHAGVRQRKAVRCLNNVMLLHLQEAYIADLDAKSGASLKLTILNPKGRIWTMVAGGGASVVYR